MGVLDYIQAFIVIGAVIFASFYVTRLMAKTSGSMRKGTNIRLIGSLPLAKDKSVVLVKVGERAYLLGVGPQRVEQLDKLALSELNLAEYEQAPSPEFAQSFKNELGKRLGKLHK